MPSCEKCWEDAYLISKETGKSQIWAYDELILKRRKSPCSAKQQAGQFWDEEKKIDLRGVNNHD